MSKNSCHVETLSVGQLATNCYIVYDKVTKDAVVIDPGDDGNYIAEKVIGLQLHPHAILLTHGHFDHILGAYELQQIFKIPCYMNTKDNFLVERMNESSEYFLHRKIIEQKPTITAISEKKLVFGTLDFTIIDCLGHTPGGVSLVLENTNTVFTGDTIFAHGYIGRTDLSYSKPLDLSVSIGKLFALSDSYTIYPGHGEPSTIGAVLSSRAKRGDPCLAGRQADEIASPAKRDRNDTT